MNLAVPIVRSEQLMAERGESDYTIQQVAAFAEDEAELAKSHWSGIGVRPFYAEGQPWAEFMSERILAFSPRAVFEFGCNVGRNLMELSKRAPDVSVSGIDINKEAIRNGVEQGLDLAVGDERTLDAYPERAFDVVFTVSVLDHLPNPIPVLDSLCRIAGRAALLLEPWLGEEGKVIQNRHPVTGELVDTTPYSYSWDYPGLHCEVVPDWAITVEPFRLRSNLGRYYELYTLKRPPA